MKKKRIILGTAHLASTPGKRSPDGRLREYEYSRRVCAEVERLLKADGYDVVTDWTDAYMESGENELRKREGIVNGVCMRMGAENVCYVSIHVNAAGMGDKWMRASYWSVWTSKGQTRGDKLADCLYEAARQELTPRKKTVQGDWSDGDGDYEANFYVLKNTKCAAALTENLFQDNKGDVDFLLSDDGFKAIVDLHVKGIKKYVDNAQCTMNNSQ